MLRNPGLRKSVEQPVLDLNFAASQIGSNGAPDARMNDFNRGSNAWFVDTDGLVKKSPHNLSLYSEDFTQWAVSAGVVTANQIAAPDGSLTADLLADDGTTGNHRFSRLIGANTIGETMFASIYVKATSDNTTILWREDKEDALSFGFNPTTGQITSGTGTAEDVGNGWYRLTITGALASQTVWSPEIRFSGTPASVYVWGAQLSQHTTLPVDNPYVKTETSQVFAARLDHDPSWFMSAAQEQNLLRYSEMLDQSGGGLNWGLQKVNVTANAGTDPLGGSTAELVLEDSTTGNHICKSPDFDVTAGKIYTVSCYVKLHAGTRKFRISISSAAGGFTFVYAQFTVTNETCVLQVGDTTNTIEDVGNGWFRVSIQSATATESVKTGQVNFQLVSSTTNYQGDGTSGFFIWGTQVEVGSTASTYHRTEGAPYYGEGATAKGLLIEEQRTNLFQYSEEFDLAAWTTSRASVTANAVLAPDGTVTADKLVEDTTASNTHQIAETVSSLTAQPYTFSVFAKAGERDHIQLLLYTGAFGANVARADFDLTNETSSTVAGTIDNSSITAVGNGWYRVLITVTATTTGSGIAIIYLADNGNVGYTGDGSSGLYIWGAQLEAGSFATSYIKNSGTLAGVTRDDDVAIMGPTTGGTELVTNGTFDTDTSNWTVVRGATLSVSSGQLTVAGDGAQFGCGAIQGFGTVAGRRYRASFDIVSVSASNAGRVSITNLSDDAGSVFADATSLNAGNGQTLDFTAEQATSYIVVRAQTISTTVVYDNVSVRELYPFEQYNPAEGTVVCDFERIGDTSFDYVWSFDDGTTANAMSVLSLNATHVYFGHVADSVNGLTFKSYGVEAGEPTFTAYAYKQDSTHIALGRPDLSGIQISFTDTSIGVAASDRLGIGVRPRDEVGQGNCLIKRLTYYPYRLNDDVCDSKVSS